MEEIEIKNKLNIKVFTDDFPDLSKIPNEVFNAFVLSLEQELTEIHKQRNQRKKQYKNYKKKNCKNTWQSNTCSI